MQKIIKHSNESDNAVVFIHGFPFDHHMWKKQVDYFRKNYTCVSYDIRGLGQSSAQGGQFSIEDLVDDLFNVISVTRIEKPVVCGLSMGGYIALRAVEKDENKFSGLILCDSKSEADSNTAKLKRAAGIKFINQNGGSEFASAFVNECFTPDSINNIEIDYLKILKRSVKTSPVGLKACLLAMAGRTDTTSYLPQMKIPALILCGEEDNFAPPAVMFDISEKINNSEFHVIVNSGHMSPVENPAVVNGHISGFLKNVFS